MKIALLGGTFDPPHKGHEMIAQYMLANKLHPVDEVWFVPTYEQKYFGIDPAKKASPYGVRLEMTKLLSATISHTRVSTIERDYKLSGQTKDLFQHLPKGNEYAFIIGTDQLASFHRWGEYETLLKTMPFLVYPRPDHSKEPKYDGMIFFDGDAPVSDCSSTQIRTMMARGQQVNDFVLPEVMRIIERDGLYQSVHRKEQK